LQRASVAHRSRVWLKIMNVMGWLEAVSEVDKRGARAARNMALGTTIVRVSGIVRAERLQPVLDRRGGWIVNLTGDGALIEFVSAVEALSANIEFQQTTTETESQRQEAKRLVFRVGLGLHLVNIRPGPTAARLL
jgi:class 3 adenylate cyclase